MFFTSVKEIDSSWKEINRMLIKVTNSLLSELINKLLVK